MSGLFVLLFLISIVALIVGLAKPHKFEKVFKSRTDRSVIGASLGALSVFLFIMVGVTAASPHKNLSAPSNTTPKVSAPVVTSNTLSTTEPIAFTSTTEKDPSLANGTTAVKTVGVNGLQTHTWKITYSDGVETGRVSLSTVTTSQPIAEVIRQGTYVAPTPVAVPAPVTPAPVTQSPSSSTSCTPLTNGGNCYRAGEYCRNSDHGTTGIAGNGERITCLNNNGWRWEPS